MKTQIKFWITLIVMTTIVACDTENDPQPNQIKQKENKDLLEVIGAIQE